MHKRRPNIIILTILVILSLLLLIYVYNNDPEKGPILPCIFNKITGYKCPGCGMTRAVNAIMHRDIKAAFGYNKLVLIIPIGFIIYIFFRILKRDTDKLLWFYLIIIILYGIVRNI